jgi:hypothetical protein
MSASAPSLISATERSRRRWVDGLPIADEERNLLAAIPMKDDKG